MSADLDRLAAALANRCRIERELGTGGMATVYLAEDLKHDRKVAIKVLRPELAAVLGAERFVQEIRTTAALNHPHILPLFDSGEAEGFLYYVMPYIQGETIREKLNRETQFGIEEAVKITTEVADAHSGRELCFVSGNRKLVSQAAAAGAAFQLGKQRVLFRVGEFYGLGGDANTYFGFDVSPDDRRFLMVRARMEDRADPTTTAVLVEPWLTELRSERAANR